jgi:hypothetical protein
MSEGVLPAPQIEWHPPSTLRALNTFLIVLVISERFVTEAHHLFCTEYVASSSSEMEEGGKLALFFLYFLLPLCTLS